ADGRGVLLVQNRGTGGAIVGTGESRERLDAIGAERQPTHRMPAIVVPSKSQRGVARVAHVGRAEGGVTVGPLERQLEIRPETGVVLVVILLGDDRAVGQLRLEVE